MPLDVVLVNPGGRSTAYQSLGRELAAVEPPIWAGQIAAFVRQRGLSVVVVDANAEELSPEETALRIGELSPLLTAVVVYGHNPSASTQVMPAAGAMCRAVKKHCPQTAVLLVGGHVAAVPERTLREESADFVCGGEGPHTVCDLIEYLRAGGREEPRKVRDLWYRGEDGTVRSTAPAPLVMDLDASMPGIAWDLLPMERYRAHNWHCFGGYRREPYAALYTTLGCPFHCTFCCIQAPFRRGEQASGFKPGVNSYRLWSPSAVLKQLEIVVERYGVRNVKIADELFVLKKDHVAAICDGIIERGWDLNIWAYARVDTLFEPLLEKMRRAGFRWLALGIESGNARVRKGVKKAFTPEKLAAGLERLRSHDISLCGNYIFGLPDDDLASMEDTLSLAFEVNSQWANFYCAMAYPGSALYELALSENWPLPPSWSGYAQLSVDTFPLPTRYLSPAEVLQFRDEAFQRYFSNQHYLEHICMRFGEETVAEIRAMTQHTLNRNLYACRSQKR